MDVRLIGIVQENPDVFQHGFDVWLSHNRSVFDGIVTQAMRVRARGFKHYAIGTLWEVARHHSALSEKYGTFKLNNIWRADVARLIMLAYPQFEDFFEVRERRTSRLGSYVPERDSAPAG